MFIKTCIYNNNNKKKNREYKYTCSRLNNKLHYSMKWWVVNFSFHKKGGNNKKIQYIAWYTCLCLKKEKH